MTIEDMDGVSHTVAVTADSLYEAVARGLAAIRGKEWIMAIAQGQNEIKVQVADIPVDHKVKLSEFMNWVERKGGTSPKDVIARNKIRDILQLNRPG